MSVYDRRENDWSWRDVDNRIRRIENILLVNNNIESQKSIRRIFFNNVEKIKLTADNISDGFIRLKHKPYSISAFNAVSLQGYSSVQYADFELDLEKGLIKWAGLGWDGVLLTGNNLEFFYSYV